MPTYEHGENKSMVNPQPIIGVEALAMLTPPQGDALLLRVIEKLADQVAKLENRIKYLEKYETNNSIPIRVSTGDDEFISVSQTEENIVISFDEEKLTESISAGGVPGTGTFFPPPARAYLDKYRHCTDPGANPDVLIPSNITDTQINADGSLVLKIGYADGSFKCYYLLERNAMGAPTVYASLAKQEACDDCEDVPSPNPPDPPVDPPDGDYPYFDGWVMADFECANDDTGALIITIKFVNLQTGEIKFEVREGCCCRTDAPLDPPATVAVDRWRPCGAGDYAGDDIFLMPAIYDLAETADPIVQLSGSGTCYRFVAETADEVINISPLEYMSTCDDSDCDPYSPPPDETPLDCSNSDEAVQPDVVIVNNDVDSNNDGIIADGPFVFFNYADFGTYCQWEWRSTNYSFTVRYGFDSPGVYDAHLFDTGAGTVRFGEFPFCGIGTYKVVPDIIVDGDGVISGTFVLTSYSPGGCGFGRTSVTVTLG